MAAIAEVEGIGPAATERLSAAGIATTAQLLQQGAAAQGGAEIAATAGIAPATILRWVNHADLERSKGIGWEYADLLEAAGVDSVPELARRNAANLHAAMTAANAAKQLVRRLPTPEQVQAWVAEAKTLAPVVLH
jgi:predicted flap endonuclease-1-like 5' DNA nuclease